MSLSASSGGGDVAPDEAERALRARLYLMLARLLSAPPDRALLDALAASAPEEREAPLARALADLAAAAARTTPALADEEFQRLFVGVVRGELVPYASWYLTGFLAERPLLRLRTDMAALGIARAPEVREPDDHVAALCEMMAGLVSGLFPASDGAQARFLARHLVPWAPRFFADLEGAAVVPIYASLGAVGAAFLEVEIALGEEATGGEATGAPPFRGERSPSS